MPRRRTPTRGVVGASSTPAFGSRRCAKCGSGVMREGSEDSLRPTTDARAWGRRQLSPQPCNQQSGGWYRHLHSRSDGSSDSSEWWGRQDPRKGTGKQTIPRRRPSLAFSGCKDRDLETERSYNEASAAPSSIAMRLPSMRLQLTPARSPFSISRPVPSILGLAHVVRSRGLDIHPRVRCSARCGEVSTTSLEGILRRRIALRPATTAAPAHPRDDTSTQLSPHANKPRRPPTQSRQRGEVSTVVEENSVSRSIEERGTPIPKTHRTQARVSPALRRSS